jgi:hypothetical protein
MDSTGGVEQPGLPRFTSFMAPPGASGGRLGYAEILPGEFFNRLDHYRTHGSPVATWTHIALVPNKGENTELSDPLFANLGN